MTLTVCDKCGLVIKNEGDHNIVRVFSAVVDADDKRDDTSYLKFDYCQACVSGLRGGFAPKSVELAGPEGGS